jgi:tRNA pseudouridine38-40 synthase
MQRIHLELSYNGGAYEGWQIQPNRTTVQGTIEEVLAKLNGNTPIRITGCGRTDTGVHAQQYFAHFEGEFSELDQLKYKMNKMLPNTIVIHMRDSMPSGGPISTSFANTRTHFRILFGGYLSDQWILPQ